jgi:hypothetical protein
MVDEVELYENNLEFERKVRSRLVLVLSDQTIFKLSHE